jgi:hypothetical protein
MPEPIAVPATGKMAVPIAAPAAAVVEVVAAVARIPPE